MSVKPTQVWAVSSDKTGAIFILNDHKPLPDGGWYLSNVLGWCCFVQMSIISPFSTYFCATSFRIQSIPFVHWLTKVYRTTTHIVRKDRFEHVRETCYPEVGLVGRVEFPFLPLFLRLSSLPAGWAPATNVSLHTCHFLPQLSLHGKEEETGGEWWV